jgi:hypothetical protein
MPSVTWRRDQSTPPTIVLEGVLDETANLEDLAKLLDAPVVLDLRGIRRVSSAGTRNWLNLVRRVYANKLPLRACSTALVEQMNMLLDFTGGANVESILVPFECAACSRSENILIAVPSLRAQLTQGPLKQPSCPQCKSAMELAADAESYFMFLRYI